ncbi:MAG: hypothetical protein JSV78_03630 [Phycisphaerales bacterium]|nr:MAG: hypothetical protein JSV78_03630 [Phycisphaerales bacterium]
MAPLQSTYSTEEGTHDTAGAFVCDNRQNGSFIVSADMREAVLGPSSPDWFRLEDECRAEKVKEGRQRATWRVSLSGTEVYAKVFEPRGVVQWTKRALLGDPAKREWRSHQEAFKRRIPVAQCLGVGCRSKPRSKYVLLTRAVSGGRPLDRAWDECQRPPVGSMARPGLVVLIDGVARAFAVAHHAGCRHRDAHPGNILLRQTAGGTWQAVFTDLLGAGFSRQPVGMPVAARVLAQLDQYFHRYASRTDRTRFLRAYLAYRRELDADTGTLCSLRTLALKVADASLRHRKRQALRWDRRLRRNGKYFARFRLADGWTARVALRLERRHVFPEAATPDRTEADWRRILRSLLRHEAFDKDPSNPDGIVVEGVAAGPSMAVGFLQRLEWTLRGSEASRRFERCHRLRHRDRANPLILGVMEHRTGGLIDRTLLLTPENSGTAG